MYKAHPVQIAHGGRLYNGSYRVAKDVLSVDSAYGSRSIDLRSRSDHKAQAAIVFEQLVEQWEA